MTFLERSKEGRIKGAGFVPVSAEHRIVPISFENGFIGETVQSGLENNLGARKKTNSGQQKNEVDLQDENIEKRVVPIRLENGDFIVPGSKKHEIVDSYQYAKATVDDEDDNAEAIIFKNENMTANNTTNQLWREPSLRYSNTSQNVYNSLKKKPKKPPPKQQRNGKVKTPPSNRRVPPSYSNTSLDSHGLEYQSSGGVSSRDNSFESMNKDEDYLSKQKSTSKEGTRSIQYRNGIQDAQKSPNLRHNTDIRINGTTFGKNKNGSAAKSEFVAQDEEDFDNDGQEMKTNVVVTEEACFACDACTQTEKKKCIIM